MLILESRNTFQASWIVSEYSLLMFTIQELGVKNGIIKSRGKAPATQIQFL